MSAAPVALVGVTASGKSALAMAAARRLGRLELVSVDSMQVYRGMDIGAAKPTAAERAEVPHHLLDLADPGEEFSVTRFRDAGRAALADISARGVRALLVGGTGLYLRALIDPLDIPPRFPDVAAELAGVADTAELHARLSRLDPAAAAKMNPANRRRVIRALEVTLGAGRPFSSFGPGLDQYPPTPVRLLGVRLPRAVIDQRIAARYQAQLAEGFLGEVERLAAAPGGLSRTAAQALGYKELLAHLERRCSLEEAVELASARTRRFARRQERWLRRDPRIRWLDAGQDPLDVLDELLGALCASV
ncbi:MAG: tRNA (adenosine(37)-N6)-dimethylallyltransferase MiaA [Acidimicrobiales bacterium]